MRVLLQMSPGCAGGAIFNSRAIRAVSAGMSARAVIGALRITAPGGLQNGLRQARTGMLEPDPCCDLAKGARALAPVMAQLFGTIVDPALDQRNDRRSVLELGKAFDALGPQRLVVCLTFGRPSVGNALQVAGEEQYCRTV